MQNSLQKRVWEKVWTSQFEHIDELIKGCDSRVDNALRFVNDKPRILDAGCGLGQVVFNLLQRGHDAYGVDYDVNIIDQAKRIAEKKHVDRDRFRCGDILNLPYGDDSFDMYMSYGVIEHFTKRQHTRIIGEARRIVRDGGVIYLYYPNVYSLFGIQCYVLSRLGLRHIWQIPLSLSYINNMLMRFNIEVIHSASCSFSGGIHRALCLNREFFKDVIPNPFYFFRHRIIEVASSHEHGLMKYGHINVTVGVNHKT